MSVRSRRSRAVQERVETVGLDPIERSVFCELYDYEGPLSGPELVRRTGYGLPSVYRALERLRATWLVDMTDTGTDPTDRSTQMWTVSNMAGLTGVEQRFYRRVRDGRRPVDLLDVAEWPELREWQSFSAPGTTPNAEELLETLVTKGWLFRYPPASGANINRYVAKPPFPVRLALLGLLTVAVAACLVYAWRNFS